MPPAQGFDALLDAWRDRIGTVPGAGSWVCPRCCGPKDSSYSYCLGCARVFANAPPSLRTRVVPLTSTLEHGPWYSQLLWYKTTSSEPWPLLGGLVIRFAGIHAERIAELLGGGPTITTVVPSKRGRAVLDHPLYRMLNGAVTAQPGVLPVPRALLEYTGSGVGRQTYAPNAFRAVGTEINGARIVLVEDSWTSGATAISAAGALLEAGAEYVVVLAIARLVKESFWSAEHPYLQAMRAPYDIGRWPH